MTRQISTGTCTFRHRELSKASMTRRLESREQRMMQGEIESRQKAKKIVRSVSFLTFKTVQPCSGSSKIDDLGKATKENMSCPLLLYLSFPKESEQRSGRYSTRERDEYSTHDASHSRDRLRISLLGGVLALPVASA
jgi:hypothetical protein